jgi:HTH-type transcriptional regulator / antitoxin HigA
MITNERQYKITKSEIAKFKEAILSFKNEADVAEDIHPQILDAQRDALEFKLQELENEVRQYELLKTGQLLIDSVDNLNDLPLVLIKARIVNGLTQADLARKLGMKEQQIQRYESSKYESASLKTILRIADILGISLKGDIQLKEVGDLDQINLKNYPFKQMFQRNWFESSLTSLNDAVNKSAELLTNLFDRAGISNLKLAFNKRTIRSKGALNQFALNAWYARTLIKAREQELDVFFDKSFVTPDLLKQLSELSQKEEGPRIAVERLKQIGIRVVFEEQLEGTHLDGAAFLLDDIFPVIALTLRYDRLDNFWFVLFHELGHIVLHLGFDYTIIFDDLDVNGEGLEIEADQFALNAMIPDTLWKKSLVRFNPTNESIINQAKKFKVHKSIIAGRIRRETGRYFEFTDLVGQGLVRKMFIQELI